MANLLVLDRLKLLLEVPFVLFISSTVLFEAQMLLQVQCLPLLQAVDYSSRLIPNSMQLEIEQVLKKYRFR